MALLAALVRLGLVLSGMAYSTVPAMAEHTRELQEDLRNLDHALEGAQATQLELYEHLQLLYDQLTETQQELAEMSRRVLYAPPHRIAYLTFDDGPSQNTAAILDILRHYGIKATFFVTGNTTPYGQAIYRRIVDEGHSLGNHTFSHNYSYIYESIENYLEDHYRLEELLYETTGVKPQIIRFPGGSNNTVSEHYGGAGFMNSLTQHLLTLGYDYYDWNVSSLDAAQVTQETEVIIEAVISRVRGRSSPVILLHDSAAKTTTVEALPVIIETLISMGYSFGVSGPGSFPVRFI